MNSEMKPMKCPKCGGEVPSGSAFCLHCGHKLAAEKFASAESQPATNTSDDEFLISSDQSTANTDGTDRSTDAKPISTVGNSVTSKPVEQGDPFAAERAKYRQKTPVQLLGDLRAMINKAYYDEAIVIAETILEVSKKPDSAVCVEARQFLARHKRM